MVTAGGVRQVPAIGAGLQASVPRRDGGAAPSDPAPSGPVPTGPPDTFIRPRLFDFGSFKPSGDLPIRHGRYGALKFGGKATFKRCDERGLDLTIHAQALRGLIQVDVRFAYDLLPDGKVAYRGKREDGGPRRGAEPQSGDFVLEVVEQRPGRTVLQSATGKQAILSHDPERGTFTLTYDTFSVTVEAGGLDSGK